MHADMCVHAWGPSPARRRPHLQVEHLHLVLELLARDLARDMRLQRKARWKEMFDEASQRPFYYNQISGEIRWRRPQDLLQLLRRPVCGNCECVVAALASSLALSRAARANERNAGSAAQCHWAPVAMHRRWTAAIHRRWTARGAVKGAAGIS